MRWGIVAAGALLTVCSAAEASDLGRAPVPVLRSWDGLYLGLHGGFAGGEFKYPGGYSVEGFTVASGDMTLNSSGLYGGAQAGYNFQPGPNWLLGVEADISAADINGTLDANASIFEMGEFSGSVGSKVDWFGTVRGRLGWVSGPILLYGTGGLAYGNVKSALTASGFGDGINWSTSKTAYGWTAGAGIEYAVTPAISLKTEYKYVDLGSVDIPTITYHGDPINIQAETRFHAIEVGLNYRFGEGAAPEPVATNWHGFYAGVQGGLGGDQLTGSADVTAEGTSLGNGDASAHASGFFGGVEAGYNFQTAPNWLVGVEGDVSAADIEGKLKGNANVFGADFSADIGAKVDWFGTLRGRLGWIYGPLLVYGTGGVAYGQTTLSLNGSGMGIGVDISTSKANWGWTAGAGFEYALTGNVSLKTEYKYVDLGTVDVASLSFEPYAGALKQETKFHTVQMGLNYRF